MSGVVASRFRSGAVDRFGAFASGACAVHCAVCSLLPGMLVALGLGALLSHEAEWALTLAAIAFASVALLHGWREHRSTWILPVLAIGIVGLLASRALEEASVHEIGTGVGVAAGIALVVGHVSNLRALRRSYVERA